jgi:polygalacturonase
MHLENVAITGEGVFNGNGYKWWRLDEEKNKYGARVSGAASGDLIKMVEDGVPIEERIFDKEESGMRPYFLHLLYCKNLLIEGVRFINAPFWCVCPTFSENIIIRNISFLSPKGSHNTDSVDIDSCKNCLVEGIRVDCSSDDGVVIKSGRDLDGIDANWPTENVLVRNCEFHCSGGTVAIGSETSGGIRNVYIHDITGDDCSCVVNIKTAPGRGNVIENIDIENVKGNKAISGANISMRYSALTDDNINRMPLVRNISYKNIEIGLAWHGPRILGFEKFPLENIHLENIKVKCIETTGVIQFVDGLHINNFETSFDHENWFDWQTHGRKGITED